MEESATYDIRSDTEELWRNFAQTRHPELRRELVGLYLDMTHRIAAHLYALRINDAVEFEDYLQYARVGLLEAIDRYDPTREANFATFANYRIRGAILNGLEKTTEGAAQAAERRAIRLRERAQSLQESCEEESTATHPFEEMVDITLMLAMGYVLEDSGEWNPAGADRASDPYRSVHLEGMKARLKMLVDALPERERLIVRYHYFEHMEFQMVGELMKLSKGRISQLHARALRLIRESYRALDSFDLDI